MTDFAVLVSVGFDETMSNPFLGSQSESSQKLRF